MREVQSWAMALSPQRHLETLKSSSLEGGHMSVTGERATKKATCKKIVSIALKSVVDISVLRGCADPPFRLCWN